MVKIIYNIYKDVVYIKMVLIGGLDIYCNWSGKRGKVFFFDEFDIMIFFIIELGLLLLKLDFELDILILFIDLSEGDFLGLGLGLHGLLDDILLLLHHDLDHHRIELLLLLHHVQVHAVAHRPLHARGVHHLLLLLHHHLLLHHLLLHHLLLHHLLLKMHRVHLLLLLGLHYSVRLLLLQLLLLLLRSCF